MLLRQNVAVDSPMGSSWAPPECGDVCTLFQMALTSNGTVWGINEHTDSVYRCDDLAGSGAVWPQFPVVSGTTAVQVAANSAGVVLYRSDKNGLYVSDDAAATWREVSAVFDVLDVAINDEGVVWIISSAGVGYAGGNLTSWTSVPGLPSGTCEKIASAGSITETACIDHEGNLWHLSTSIWKQIGSGVVTNATTISMTEEGQLWVSTADGGVYFTDTNSGFKDLVPIAPSEGPLAGAPNDCLSVVASMGQVGAAETNDVVPRPHTILSYAAHVTIDPSAFTFAAVGEKSDILAKALARYQALTFPPSLSSGGRGGGMPVASWPRPRAGTPAQNATGIDVQVLANDTSLGLETNESYTLLIQAPRVKVVAASVFGALHGLETFSQLVSSRLAKAPGPVTLRWQTVQDAPRFAYRGLMIDPARRFLPVGTILSVIDGMAYEKLNVLHMHLTDDQSFPIVLPDHPELSASAAFHPNLVYSPANITTIVDYARDRGVRVIPELDTPGHSTSWSYSHPEATVACGPGSALLDPTANVTYDLLRGVFTDVFKLFPDAYAFLGGDEVNTACWSGNANVSAWLKAHGVAAADLQAYYEERLIGIVRGEMRKEVLVWQEVFQHAKVPNVTLGDSAVVSVWKGADYATLTAVVKAGLRAVLSGPWYLDMINDDTAWGREWKKYYAVDPQAAVAGTEAERALVIGGHGAIWGEAVDMTNIVQRTWPRLSAVAERLWSNANITDVADFGRRLHAHRCRMRRRGLPASPVGLWSGVQNKESWQARGWCDGDAEYSYHPPF